MSTVIFKTLKYSLAIEILLLFFEALNGKKLKEKLNLRFDA